VCPSTGCPDGTFCPNSGTTLADAQLCPAGTFCAYSQYGTPAPADCSIGTFSGWAVLSDDVAFALPYDKDDAARQPQPAPVGAACLTCPDGYTCTDAAAPPGLCPGGAAAGEGGATYRLNDPPGETASEDLADPSTCVPCPAGSACPAPNAAPVRGRAGCEMWGGVLLCGASDAREC
jgi:hypothetical protein